MKFRHKVSFFLTSMLLMFYQVASANTTTSDTAIKETDPGIVKGTKNLISDATTWLLYLAGGAAVLMIIYFSIQKKFAQDAVASAEASKRIKAVIIAAIIAVSAAGIVKAINHYYGT